VSHTVVALARADSPSEHFQLAAFTAMSAVVFIWLGRRERRTGRHLLAPSETVRVGDRLIPPPPPSRGRRIAGRVWITVGGLFVLPAVLNAAAAVKELIG
jgi:hypothetical protein